MDSSVPILERIIEQNNVGMMLYSFWMPIDWNCILGLRKLCDTDGSLKSIQEIGIKFFTITGMKFGRKWKEY